MGFVEKIPPLGHFKRGEKGKGLLISTLCLIFISFMIFKSHLMVEAVEKTLAKIQGEEIPYGSTEIDLLISTLFLPLAALGLMLYSFISLRKPVANTNYAEGPWVTVWRKFKKNRLAMTGGLIILSLYIIAILCPYIAPHDPTEQFDRVYDQLLPPSTKHLLGTDEFSRDAFSRIIYGSRISLLVGLLAVAIAVSLGTLYGAISGYFGGWIDNLMMRFVDIMLAFPTLILIITVIALWQNQSIWIIISVIGLMSWMGVARLVRGQFLVLKEREYFIAAKALGASGPRLIFKHLLPNAMTPIIVSATLRVGTTILLEASLSFLSLGVQPPEPSWGNIVFDTKGQIFSDTLWCMPLAAGLAIVITVTGYNLLGDGLRDALDPRLRK